MPTPSRSFCEVIETYDGFVVQLEGKKHCRLTVSRCVEGSFRHPDPLNLIRDQVEAPGRYRDGIYDVYYWGNGTTNLKIFKDKKDAITMAMRVEEVLLHQYEQDKKLYEGHLMKQQEDRERAAFVEKKVWR